MAEWAAIFTLVHPQTQEKESMKSIFVCLLVFCAGIAVTGCDSGGEASSVVDGAAQSDVDKYNAMMEESMAGYEEAEQAASEGGADQ